MKKEIIDRFLRGDLNEEDKADVFQWLVSNRNESEVNAFLKNNWETVDKENVPFEADMDGILEHTLASIADEKVVQMQSIEPDSSFNNKTFVFPSFLKYAAAVVVLIISSMVYFTFDQEEKSQVVETMIVKNNPKGVKSQIQLPDGTKVWLNAASSITYLPSFSASARLIQLDGEAYFEVVKDVNRPFRVTSGQLTTTALGTSFNINAYKPNLVKVSLYTGKVDVKRLDNNKNVILYPGDQADASHLGLSVVKYDEEGVLAWKQGKIFFDNTDFDEMISILEKWYNVSFIVENLSAEQRERMEVTGRFKNQTLSSVLMLLSHSLEFEYVIKNKVVTLKF